VCECCCGECKGAESGVIINNKERFLKNNEIVSNIINDRTDYNYFESLM
jgi:hypothetical protein